MSEDLNEVVYEFHEMLYDRLLYYGHADAVVRTRSPYVKRFLAAGGSREPFSDRPDGSPREKWMNRAGDFVDPGCSGSTSTAGQLRPGDFDDAGARAGQRRSSLHRPLLPPRGDDDGLQAEPRESAAERAPGRHGGAARGATRARLG